MQEIDMGNTKPQNLENNLTKLNKMSKMTNIIPEKQEMNKKSLQSELTQFSKDLEAKVTEKKKKKNQETKI